MWPSHQRQRYAARHLKVDIWIDTAPCFPRKTLDIHLGFQRFRILFMYNKQVHLDLAASLVHKTCACEGTSKRACDCSVCLFVALPYSRISGYEKQYTVKTVLDVARLEVYTTSHDSHSAGGLRWCRSLSCTVYPDRAKTIRAPLDLKPYFCPTSRSLEGHAF